MLKFALRPPYKQIGVLLNILGLRFGDAGLQDLVIESNVIAEGSTEKVLNGKHYNRGIRFHKLMFEACFRLIWESFQLWIEDSSNKEKQDTVTEALNQVSTLNSQDDTDEASYQLISNYQQVSKTFSLFIEFCDMLRRKKWHPFTVLDDIY